MSKTQEQTEERIRVVEQWSTYLATKAAGVAGVVIFAYDTLGGKDILHAIHNGDQMALGAGVAILGGKRLAGFASKFLNAL